MWSLKCSRNRMSLRTVRFMICHFLMCVMQSVHENTSCCIQTIIYIYKYIHQKKTPDAVSVWLTEQNSLQVPRQSVHSRCIWQNPYLLPAVHLFDPGVSQQCCTTQPEPKKHVIIIMLNSWRCITYWTADKPLTSGSMVTMFTQAINPSLVRPVQSYET